MLSASTGYMDGINGLLKSILPVNHLATIALTTNGLLVNVVDKSQTCSANTLLLTSLFASYELEQQSNIAISLKLLCSCLQMYVDWAEEKTSSIRVILQYQGGESFQVRCGLDSVRSNCQLQIYDITDAGDLGPHIDKSNIELHMICAGSKFSHILKVLEKLDATGFRISAQVTPVTCVFFEGTGVGCSTSFRFSDESVDALVVEAAFEYNYDFKGILKLKESLKTTTSMNIRCDGFGVINIQMIHEIEDQNYVINYLFAPLEVI